MTSFRTRKEAARKAKPLNRENMSAVLRRLLFPLLPSHESGHLTAVFSGFYALRLLGSGRQTSRIKSTQSHYPHRSHVAWQGRRAPGGDKLQPALMLSHRAPSWRGSTQPLAKWSVNRLRVSRKDGSSNYEWQHLLWGQTAPSGCD